MLHMWTLLVAVDHIDCMQSVQWGVYCTVQFEMLIKNAVRDFILSTQRNLFVIDAKKPSKETFPKTWSPIIHLLQIADMGSKYSSVSMNNGKMYTQ